MTRFLTVLLLAAMTSPVTAQWLNHPTPGIPRTSDGKPNLGAPPPHTSDGKLDLSGIWNGSPPALKPPDGSVKPWAVALMKQREENFFKDRPSYRCLPSGPEQTFGWKRIVQTPTLIVILYEANYGLRYIYMDGRSLPPQGEPQPFWYGYSVGRWEGDTLVVETNNLRGAETGPNDGWLDVRGSPYSDQARFVERFRRPVFGKLEIDVTVDDSKSYTKPFTVRINQRFLADEEPIEFVCNENNQFRQRIKVN